MQNCTTLTVRGQYTVFRDFDVSCISIVEGPYGDVFELLLGGSVRRYVVQLLMTVIALARAYSRFS